MTINYFRSVGSVTERPARLRRSCLAVPGSNPKMMAKAAGGEADQIFLDLEDAVAPEEKKSARAKVVEALNTNDYRGKVVVVRVNDATTRYCYDDIIELVRGAGDAIDCLMIPKVQDAGQLWFVEYLLNQLEADLSTSKRIGLEVQIETGTGSVNMSEIAQVTDRTETLIFGPGDYAANMGVPQLDLGMIEPHFPVTSGTTSWPRSSTPPERSAPTPSTGRTATTATSTATGSQRPAPSCWASTASGAFIHRRSPSPTRSSRPAASSSTSPNGCLRPTPRRLRPARARRRWTAR